MNFQEIQGLSFYEHSHGGLKKIYLRSVRNTSPFPIYALTTCSESSLAMSHSSLYGPAVSELFGRSWNFMASHASVPLHVLISLGFACNF